MGVWFSVLPLSIKLNIFLVIEGLTQMLLKWVEKHPLRRASSELLHSEDN